MKRKYLAIALLFSAPTLTFAERISIEDLANKMDDKPELRFVSIVNEPLDGNNANFQIRVICQDDFNVRSVYATARDPGTSVDITYSRVNLLSNVFGDGFTPPFNWLVAHQDLSITVGANSVGYELLSYRHWVSPTAAVLTSPAAGIPIHN